MLAAWREAPFYSERERAALDWCEALTLLPQTGAPDEVYEQLRGPFDEEEIVALTSASPSTEPPGVWASSQCR